MTCQQGRQVIVVFFHPDYTVGAGISPVQARHLIDMTKPNVAGFTAGRGFAPHPEDRGNIVILKGKVKRLVVVGNINSRVIARVLSQIPWILPTKPVAIRFIGNKY